MRKMSAIKTVIFHLLIWITWQFLQSLSLFETWRLSNKVILLYNYLSLVIVFYSIHFFAASYFKGLYYEKFAQMNILQRARYLLWRWQVLCILSIVLSYILGSWMIDTYVFNLQYPYFYLYCTGRWNVEAFYVVVGIGLSYYFEYARRQDSKLRVKDERIINLQEYITRKNGEQDMALQQLFNALEKLENKKRKEG